MYVNALLPSVKCTVFSLFVVCLAWNSVLCEDGNTDITEIRVFDYALIQHAVDNLSDSQCATDMQNYIDGLIHLQKWAMMMLDATVKFPFGLLDGHSYQFGNYDQCTGVSSSNSNSTSSDEGSFRGQYCLAEIGVAANHTSKNFSEGEIFANRKLIRRGMHKMHWGICVPSTCRHDEVRDFLQGIFAEAMPDRNLQVNVTANDCAYKIPGVPMPTAGQIIYCVAIGAFLCTVFSATCYHCFHDYKKQSNKGYTINERQEDVPLMHQLILSFSLIKNATQLVDARSKYSDYNLNCIYGIRTITMGFVLGGHALLFFISSPALNKGFAEDALKKVQNSMFINNPLMVDSFLLISGFLMCRLLLIELEKRHGCVNFVIIYISRYTRLTPAYAVVIGFYCTCLIDVGEGPLWKSRMLLEQERCLHSWWTNLLYVNNYVHTDRLCMFQAWYLSVDMHLFVLAPLVVYPLWRCRIIGELMLAVLCVGSVIIPFMVTCTQHLDPTLMMYPEELNDLSSNYYYTNYYIKTHIRANAYIVGMMFGSGVHRIQANNYRIPFMARVIFGFLAAVAGVGSMFSITIFYQDDYVYDVSEAALYAALHRLAWSLAVGWTITACITSDTYVTRFLSWRAWIPLSRLTFCAFLVNGLVELYTFGVTRTSRYLSIYSLGSEMVAHVVLTLIAAFVLCVIFESPVHGIEKLFVHKAITSNNRKKKHREDGEGTTPESPKVVKQINCHEKEKLRYVMPASRLM